jgi:hypothetical protein
VNVLRTVEAGGTTRPYAVGAEGLDGLLFESLVCDEVIEVVGREVRDGAAIGELDFGSGRSA